MFTTSQSVAFIRGPRLVLRPVLYSDLSYALRWINDPKVRKNLTASFPTTEAGEEEWYNNVCQSTSNIVLIMVVDEQPIGLHQIDRRSGVAHTATIIGEAKYRRYGYAEEAKMLLLNYAFNTLNLRKICSEVLATNNRSLKYNRRCGYIMEGRRREHCFRNGEYVDDILLAVFYKRWKPRWKVFCRKYDFHPS